MLSRKLHLNELPICNKTHHLCVSFVFVFKFRLNSSAKLLLLTDLMRGVIRNITYNAQRSVAAVTGATDANKHA